jgi:hypothetical protein
MSLYAAITQDSKCTIGLLCRFDCITRDWRIDFTVMAKANSNFTVLLQTLSLVVNGGSLGNKLRYPCLRVPSKHWKSVSKQLESCVSLLPAYCGSVSKSITIMFSNTVA